MYARPDAAQLPWGQAQSGGPLPEQSAMQQEQPQTDQGWPQQHAQEAQHAQQAQQGWQQQDQHEQQPWQQDTTQPQTQSAYAAMYFPQHQQGGPAAQGGDAAADGGMQWAATQHAQHGQEANPQWAAWQAQQAGATAVGASRAAETAQEVPWAAGGAATQQVRAMHHLNM